MKNYAWFCFLGFNHCYHPGSSSKYTHARLTIENNREGNELPLQHLEQSINFSNGDKTPCLARCVELFLPVMLNALVPSTFLN